MNGGRGHAVARETFGIRTTLIRRADMHLPHRLRHGQKKKFIFR